MKFRSHPAVKTACLLFVLGILALAFPAEAAAECGVVKKVTRTVNVTRERATMELSEGGAVHEGDIIKTGNLGHAEIRLLDNTLITMENNSMIALTLVRFDTEKALLHMSINRGEVGVSTGSIGLKNPNGIRISTSSAMVSSGNARLLFRADDDEDAEEEMDILWIPKGGKVSVYSNKSKETSDIMRAGVTVTISGENSTALTPGRP